MSAWIPAPPPESEPAMIRTRPRALMAWRYRARAGFASPNMAWAPWVRASGPGALGQERRHLGRHIVVVRLGLHGPGLALHVHQHHVAPKVGGDRQAVRSVAQGGHVVPGRGAGLDRGAGHGRLHGVDGDRDGA